MLKDLDPYPACTASHEPNSITKKAIDAASARKSLKTADSIEALFKKLSE